MKIFLITCDNGLSYEDHSNWHIKAFTKREDAVAYIVKLNESFTEYIKEIEVWQEKMKCRRALDPIIPYPTNKLEKKMFVNMIILNLELMK
jgi:hypothetical protein